MDLGDIAMAVVELEDDRALAVVTEAINLLTKETVRCRED